MIDTGYLYSKDDRRIFINTCLGCTGKCSYCYLGKIGYDNHKVVSDIKSAEELISEIETKTNISRDTLITLGCFSECWDKKNKPETMKLLKHFLEKGNQVQLSTKKQVTVDEMKQFTELIKYPGQLAIFVSSATISDWKEYENGTEALSRRFKTFEVSEKLRIPTVLYMKPILKDVTIKDIELYKRLISKYGIKDVVVGSIFGEEKTGERVHFSDKGQLFYNPVLDEVKIKQELLQMGNIRVFGRSSEVMKFYREKGKNIER